MRGSKYIEKNKKNSNLEKIIDNINDYKAYNKRERSSPFYRDEKSIRLQEEIDWMNNIVAGKSRISKMHGSNSLCDLINSSRNNMNGSSCCLTNGGKLNDVKNRIKRKKYKKFNDSIDSYYSYKKAPDPLIITTKYIKSGTFIKNDLDKHNYPKNHAKHSPQKNEPNSIIIRVLFYSKPIKSLIFK